METNEAKRLLKETIEKNKLSIKDLFEAASAETKPFQNVDPANRNKKVKP